LEAATQQFCNALIHEVRQLRHQMQLMSQQLNMDLPTEPLPSSASSGILPVIAAGHHNGAGTSAADTGAAGSSKAASLLQGLQQVLGRHLDAAGPAAGGDRSAGISSVSSGSGKMTLSVGLQLLLQQHLDELKDSSSRSSSSSSLGSSVSDSDVSSLSSGDISLSSLSSSLGSLSSLSHGAAEHHEADDLGHPAADAGSSDAPFALPAEAATAATMVQAPDMPSMSEPAEPSSLRLGADAMDAAASGTDASAGTSSSSAAGPTGTRSMATLSSSNEASSASAEALTHVDASGRATMVEVAAKQPSMREARASAKVGTAASFGETSTATESCLSSHGLHEPLHASEASYNQHCCSEAAFLCTRPDGWSSRGSCKEHRCCLWRCCAQCRCRMAAGPSRCRIVVLLLAGGCLVPAA
jgi:hypothetical protein